MQVKMHIVLALFTILKFKTEYECSFKFARIINGIKMNLFEWWLECIVHTIYIYLLLPGQAVVQWAKIRVVNHNV